MVKEMLEEAKQITLADKAGVTLKQVQSSWKTIKNFHDKHKVNWLIKKYHKKYHKKVPPKSFQRVIDELIDSDYKYTIEKVSRLVKNKPKIDNLDDIRPMVWAVRTIGDAERARKAFNAVIEMME